MRLRKQKKLRAPSGTLVPTKITLMDSMGNPVADPTVFMLEFPAKRKRTYKKNSVTLTVTPCKDGSVTVLADATVKLKP